MSQRHVNVVNIDCRYCAQCDNCDCWMADVLFAIVSGVSGLRRDARVAAHRIRIAPRRARRGAHVAFIAGRHGLQHDLRRRF